MTNQATTSLKERLVVLALTLAISVMLFTLVKDRMLHPSLTVQLHPNELQFKADQNIITNDQDEISALMQFVGNHPHDVKMILLLAQKLMQAEQLEPALNFAKRAQLEDPQNFDALYLTGMILHRTGQYTSAAETLTKALALKDDPSLRYSLGVLYCYFLKDKAAGIRHLQKGLALPNISSDLKQTLEQELQKQLGSNSQN